MSSYILSLINQYGGIDFVISLVAPLVLAFIYQRHWSTRVKTNATWIASLITSIPITLLGGQLKGDWTDLGAIIFNFALILGGTTTAHDKFYKPVGITPAIEDASTLRREPLDTQQAIKEALTPLIKSVIEKNFPNGVITPKVPVSSAAAVPVESQAQLGGVSAPADVLAGTIYNNSPLPRITQVNSSKPTGGAPLPDVVEKVDDPYEPQAG